MLPPNQPYKSVSIAVAEKIIADISTGIYRTPAAAIKELVTNAYDADATEVEISTGAPAFDQLVIRDNGVGMDIARFIEIFQHIGGSWKRLLLPDGLSEKFKRPVIGRIGIGLLAVAQLGQRFYVASSREGSPTRFLAEVDLTPFHKDDASLRRLDQTGRKDADQEEIDEDRIEIGTLRYIDGLPEHLDSHFTVITVPDPKRGLISEMYGQLREAVGADAMFSLDEPASSFEQIVEVVQRHKRADAVLDGYHYVLWELGLLAPVKYLDGGAFRNQNLIEDIGKINLQEPKGFVVTVDEYDIRRPLLFPNPRAISYGGPSPKLYPLSFDQNVAGRRLSYHGYIYAQKPRIDPVELQGFQIRIRGVGIGGFDRTWMGYPFDEGIKFGQITGEVFVAEGLESALNIDRASFRETDPHYLTLRAKLWDTLRGTVFPEFKSRQDLVRRKRDKQIKAKHEERMEKVLAAAPEPVGVSPRFEVRSAPPTISRKVGWRGKVKQEPEPNSTQERQSLVRIQGGETVIDAEAFRRLVGDLREGDKVTLTHVCNVIAAFGLWENMNQGQAEEFLQALAVAVSRGK